MRRLLVQMYEHGMGLAKWMCWRDNLYLEDTL
jgi:hypothetical protein